MKLPRNAQIWLPGLIRSSLRAHDAPVTHVWLAITDHYEPYWKQADDRAAAERVATWTDAWPKIADRHRDSQGRRPRYSFFYPAEDYRPAPIEGLAGLVRKGIADVEVHLHHDGEGEAAFRDVVRGFVDALRHEHGLLRDVRGRPAFGFIHGNWALDNSHPTGRHCGLNNELTLLRELGCYADFTLPSAPSGCQTTTVNSVYWATDDPERPKSHDTGEPVRAGGGTRDALLMVQGPLTVRRHQHRRWVPSVEAGELTHVDPPTPHRVGRWLASAPRVGTHQFIKLHTHGAQEHISGALLGGGLDTLFELVGAECRRRKLHLGFTTAWEMASVIRALAKGEDPMNPLSQ